MNIKVAFQLVNGVTQSGRRLESLADAAAKLPSFSKASRIITHPAVVSYTPPCSACGVLLADRLLQRHYQRIGILVFKSQSLQIRLPSIILPLPLSRLFLTAEVPAPVNGPSADRKHYAQVSWRTYIIDVSAFRCL